jgi:hypothetical protein
MRLRCYLREIRGTRPLRELVELCKEQDVKVNAGELSRIENGIALARDDQLPALVAAYGANVDDWYPDLVLLAIESDDAKLASIRSRLRTSLLPRDER